MGQLRHVRRGTTVMSFTYDAVGNRKQRTDYNGVLTTYDYDALNRLKTIDYPDATTVGYTYDKLSRLQTATNETGVIDFDYNKMNRLTGVTDVFGQVIDYNYDPNGNHTKLSLNAALVATHRYDAVDRLTKIVDAAGLSTNYSYDVTNKLASRRLPNGILTSYSYDGLDRLTRLLDAKGAVTVADHQYQYSTANQITQIAEATITRSYGYDAVDRLTSAAYTNPVQPPENYGYDSVGNRTSSHLSANYAYQPFNRLTTTTTTSYTYDTNGNLLSKTDSNGTTQYAWNFENRLKQVTLPNGNSVSYKYDALGRRIERSATLGSPLPVTTTIRFVYDGQDVVRDLKADGSTAADYLNGPGIDNKLRQTTATGGALYFLQDHLGSTRALTDALGNVVEQQQYDSFGNSTGSALTRYGHTGRERDPDTGLMYYRFRWYNPQVGRFISEDPIGFAGGTNFYAYVENNPIRFNDPFGLCPQEPAKPSHDADRRTDCQKLADMVQEILNKVNSKSAFLDELARTFTAANHSGTREMYRTQNMSARNEFGRSGFRSEFTVNDTSNQVRHYVAGFIFAAHWGSTIALNRMNSRETPGRDNADLALNAVSTRHGASFMTWSWRLGEARRNLTQSIRNDLCER